MRISSFRHYHCMVMCILMALTVVSCDKQDPSVTTSNRPATVPVNALWVSGADEGAYIMIIKPDNIAQHVFAGIVYHENGEQWYSGKMGLSPRYASFTDMDNKDNYLRWDGNTIFLTGSR